MESASQGTGEDAERDALQRELAELFRGDTEAADQLLPIVYAELRALAGGMFRSEGVGHTLQPTALVHEAWLKLRRSPDVERRGPAEFRALAAVVMRRILADHARRRRAQRRGGGAHRTTLIEVPERAQNEAVDLLALDEVLERLAQVDPRQLRIVELRFFGGLEVEDVAQVLGLSKTTVEREWRAARAWLSARWKEREPT